MPRGIDAIFVAVGGGGLIAGIAAYVKRLQPRHPGDRRGAGRRGRDVPLARGGTARDALTEVGLFADGVAVSQVGEETFRLCRKLVDEVVLVDTDEICAAIKDVFEETRSILEPAGALAGGGAQGVGRARPAPWADARGRDERREHELRPAALTWPSGPSWANGARRSSPSRSRSGRGASARSARSSARGTSRSSTTAMPTARRRTSSSGWSCAKRGRCATFSAVSGRTAFRPST